MDRSPGPWPRQGRYLIGRSDLEAFKMNSYDPYFKKGRWTRDDPALENRLVPWLLYLISHDPLTPHLVRVKHCRSTIGADC